MMLSGGDGGRRINMRSATRQVVTVTSRPVATFDFCCWGRCPQTPGI